jgi:hypothetical protein
MNEPPPSSDRELLALFAEDPEALAIVDAIYATQQPRADHRWIFRSTLLAAAVLVIAVVVATFTLSTSRAGIIEKALRALDSGQVVHLRLVDQRAAASIVELQSGASTPARFVLDEWISRNSDRLRTSVSINGLPVSASAFGRREEQDALRFVRDYHRALQQRTAHAARDARGLRVSFADGALGKVQVDLDQRYQPVLVRYPSGRRFSVTQLTAASTTLPRGSGSPPALGAASVSRAHTVELASLPATFAMHIPVRLAGRPLVRARLLKIRLGQRLVTAVDVIYGRGSAPLPEAYVRITLAAHPLSALGWSSWYRTSPGFAWLANEGLPTGFLRVGGMYASVQSPAGVGVVLASARKLAARAP